MDSFVTQLAELCRTHPIAPKWVFAPSHAIGHSIGERLVLEGTDWGNLRFTTPFDLALEMAAPFLVERGIMPAAEGIGPALIMRLLLDLPPTVPSYFRPLADQPHMAEALWTTLAELRMAGLTAAALPEAAFTDLRKVAELRALLDGYERHLAAEHLADRAAVYHEALVHPDICPVLPTDRWLELPGVIWAPLERGFLDRLHGQRLSSRVRPLPGLDDPRRAVTLGARIEPAATEPRSNADRLALLMAPAGTTFTDGTLTMFQAGGSEAEVEEVFRRIVAANVPLDHVEIACAGPAYVALVWEKAQRHGWPVTVGPGIPISVTHPARALLAFCDWVEAGFPAARLRRLLQSGDLNVEIEEGPSAGQAARLLARSEATWGRETYATALERLVRNDRDRAADPDLDDTIRQAATVRITHAERLAGWIARLLTLAPEPADATLGDWLDGTTAFLREFARSASALDGEARGALVDALEELKVLGGLRRSLRETLGFIRSQVDGLSVGRDRARPGTLHLAALGQAGYAGRPRTFVVGLEEGGVFPTLVEDPVLLDTEREAISPALRTGADRVTEAVHQVVARLAAFGGHVCLSFSCRDLRQYRQNAPSWLLLQAARVLEPGRQWTYEALASALGEPVSLVPDRPERALSDAGWWLAQLRGTGAAAREAIHGAFPMLARGEAAEAARESDEFTAWDGLVPEAGPRLDPRVSGIPVSATSLEELAKCPFRYFLTRGLGLEPIDAGEPDPDVWLDPLTRGSLLHDLFAAILRECRARRERPDPAQHGPRLRELGEELLAAHAALVPPPSQQVYEREHADFLRDLDLFLRFEAEDHQRETFGFEIAFGTEPGEGEPLARPEPVAIDLGPDLRFLFRGRIDRLDRLPDGRYEVVDYKTGRAFLPGGLEATFAGGRQLQHALYALAVVEILGQRDPAARVHGAYYFPTARGQRVRAAREAVPVDALAAVLRDLFAVLASGAFVHTATDEDCRFCEFGPACGTRPTERAQRKVANEANAMLAPYRRLGEHA